MNYPIIVFPGSEQLGRRLADQIGERVKVVFRHFPDGESFVRIKSNLQDQMVWVLAALNQPDPKILPLIFTAVQARKMGARKLVLVAPYLPYMRQDREFNPGECITAPVFAGLISQYFDHLITIDPHLHRFSSLKQLYDIPCHCMTAAPLVAQWITQNVHNPLVIGPDSESKQWVQDIARLAAIPFTVFSKRRLGDDQVTLVISDLKAYRKHTPVLVDDIISTGATMIKAVTLLKSRLPAPAICLGIHGIFSKNAYILLKRAGADRIVTTNTISHESNQIDVTPVLVNTINDLLSSHGAMIRPHAAPTKGSEDD